MGHPLDELIIPPNLRDQHIQGMKRFLATGENHILGRRIEINAMRADQSEFPCELALVRVDRPGPPIFTSFIRDITRRKQTQTALSKANAELEQQARKLEAIVAERTADLESTIAELERFSYSLSHDMRAPLRAIHSFVQIVLEDAHDRLRDEERDFLNKALTGSHRLDRLIQDVLAYSKVTREQINLVQVDIDSLIRQIIAERPEFREPKSAITVECPIPQVRGHEAYLTQIITNLLGNAVKFVKPGVRPVVAITCETKESRVRICFSDNGIGIPEDAREKIFGMFQRMHTEKEYSGTGIGLAIVRKAAERMRGSVGVEPKPNGGTRFWLELPVAP